MPELRKDPVVGRWVIIGSERVRRPVDFQVPKPTRRGGPCLFCAGHEPETPPELLAYRSATGDGSWRVRVVPNKFPALRVEGHLERRGHGLYDLMNGIGAHEVVIESPRHDDSLAKLSVGAVEDVLRAYRERILDLKRDQRFRAIVVFKSHGVDAGAHLEHPHSQLLATPIPPQRLNDELHHARSYHDYRERCLFCDMLHQEVGETSRLVVASEHVLAFSPFASRFPFETWILPRRHAPAFEQTGAAELRDLATVLRSVLRRLDHALGDPPYNLALHSAPFSDSESPYFHWHIEITPKVTPVAGFEWGSGFHVNPMPPEDAARFLRDTAD
ncbi:MAG TPA: galactose-1-phosphate uridylyltransferase [Candidatus Binatia bacterium]|jgi:UDPglucose--hexose-1-phosphate uridylyltransferase|nr:galactose-1-phosphate uridylyltransferase [Candidatus Binatia bacterium]